MRMRIRNIFRRPAAGLLLPTFKKRACQRASKLPRANGDGGAKHTWTLAQRINTSAH